MVSELMNISVNGQSKVPPGFRFHPTEEELLHYYLKKKISLQKIDLDVIHEVDLNKLEPWDIQERCKIGTTTQTDWYFFSHKDKKYPSGTRTNRATAAGFWKATGRDKVIYSTSSRKIIGMRKTLVFYTGRAPHGQKSDWIMYEYRLDDSCTSIESQYLMASQNNVLGDGQQDEGWVVCRIFKKRNHQNKSQGYPNMSSASMNNIGDPLCDEGKKVDNININNNNNDDYLPNDNMFVKSHEYHNRVRTMYQQPCSCNNTNPNNGDGEILVGSNYYEEESSSMVTKWSAVDQLVACQLNGQTVDQFDVHDPTYFVDRHQDLQFQVLSSLTDQSNYSQLCGLWGLTS